MRVSRILILAAPLLLAACAVTPTRTVDLRPSQVADGPRDGGSAMGLFLAGQAALSDGRADKASDYFARAQRAGLEDGALRPESFTSALLAGDIAHAAALAPTDADAAVGPKRLGQLARLVEAMASDKPKTVKSVLAEGAIGAPHRRINALLTPFAHAVAGELDAATASTDPRGDRIVEVFGALGQAQIYERARRYDEAETDYKALAGPSGGAGPFPLEYGGFLERRRRTADAVAVYDAALARSPGDIELIAARARATAKRPAPPMPSLKEGAAHAAFAAAAGAMGERQPQMAQIYLQLALRLAPGRPDAEMLLGDVLSGANDPEGARMAYASIPATSSSYTAARAKLAWTYQAADDHETAIRMANDLFKAAPSDPFVAITLADLLRANERYAESAAVLDAVLPADKPRVESDWRLLYMRGVALDRIGRGADAEKDLVAALSLRPDEPELLNFLGYMWVDRGVRLDEAQGMIEKALVSNPRSGAMVDSLAWAYYRRGDYKTAVEKLEQAVEFEPADPDINDHLGDAYWRVGRRTEAQFQWNRVLTLEPDSRRKAEAEAKIANGLGPVGPAARPAVAGR